MKILIVDDEPAVRDSIRRALQLEGYDVELAGDGAEALDRIAAHNGIDAVLLDVSMPRLDGLEACRRLRRDGNSLPVLMLTARDAVTDRVAGLDAGADDYVVKPFALEELLARLRALLRRLGPQDGDVLRFADISLDPSTREVERSGAQIDLTRTEFALLELFLLNPRQVLTRSVIFERVWGYDFGFGSNSLDVYIGYLRRKTEEGDKPRLIQTIRGVGYALRERHELPHPADARCGGRRRRRGRRRVRDHLTRSSGASFAARSTTTLQSRARDLPPRLDIVGDPDGEQYLALRPERFGGVAVFTQLVRSDGEVITAPGASGALPVSQRAIAARGARCTGRSTRTRTSRARTSAC